MILKALGAFGAVCAVAAAVGLSLGRDGNDAGDATVSSPQGTVSTPVQTQALRPAAGPGLILPIDCRLGEDCEIQNYVDRDGSGGVRDYRCGYRTYDAHNGTDFRVLDMAMQARGVSVLAAADGVVLRVRDGVPDQSVRTRGLEQVAGQECGNGLVIEHTSGLSTQYCHMASGSIAVRPGQTVTAGTPLGRVGLSGQTEYPHLHFTVRRGDQIIDPFAPDTDDATCQTASASLWASAPASAMPYQQRAVLNAGMSSGPVTMEAIEAGTVASARSGGETLVAYVRALGLQPGDVERLVVTGPDGRNLVDHRGQPHTTHRAQQMTFSGKRGNGQSWPRGRYEATYSVVANGQPVLEHRFSVVL